MIKIKLSLLFFLCFSLGWSQLPVKEKTLKVMDFKIVEGDTLKVHWYAAESQNNKSMGAIVSFLEEVGEEYLIPISKDKPRIFLSGD
jgi:hypothetical protein